MRFDKFTIKSQELIQNAQSLASQHHNQQIEPEHLLAAMLTEQKGIAGNLLRKLGISPGGVAQETAIAIDKLPKISGSAVGDTYISNKAKGVLDAAFLESAKMKDQYVSIEHILQL
jgi:ATP-dependent Clp protease ATP-binding subunit ClpB